MKRKLVKCPACGIEQSYGARKECWCGQEMPKILKYEIQKWIGIILSIIVIVACAAAWFLGLAGFWYFVWIPVVVFVGYYLYIGFQFLLAGNELVKLAFVKRNMAIRYTLVLGVIFLLIEIFRGQSIAASFSPHHYFQYRDELLRTATKYDDNGTPYQIPVAWFDGQHQLNVYYINDQNPTTWYRDHSGKWHHAHDLDYGTVQMIMWGIEIAILVVVYKKTKKFEQALYKDESAEL